MHPDLAALLESYNQIVDSYEAGSLSQEDAYHALTQLRVVDADGYEWSVDVSTGQLTKTQPGGSPQPADPATFATARVYAENDPWSSQGAFTRPADPTPPPPGMPSSRQGRPLPDSGIVAPARFGALSDLWNTRRRLVLLVAGGLVLLIAVIALASGPSSSPDRITPSTLPTATVPLGTPTTVTTRRSTPTTTAASSTTIQIVVPTGEEMASVLTAISSGNRETVAAAVAAETDPTELALRTAQYAGYAATGLILQPRAAVAADGKILAAVDLIDADSGETLRQATAVWTKGDVAWMLSEFLDF